MSVNPARFVSTTLTYGIGALSLVLVLELAWFAFGDTDSSRQASEPPNINKSQVLSIRDIGTEQDFQEVSDRPLFVWNRKPVPVDDEAPQIATSDITSRWELSGIVASGTSHYAYFTPTGGGQPTRLEQGMYFEKWKVQAIEPEQVVLSDGDSSDGGSSGGESSEGESSDGGSSGEESSEGESSDRASASEAEQKIFRLKEMTDPAKPKNARSSLAARKAAQLKQLRQNRTASQANPNKAPDPAEETEVSSPANPN